MPRRGEIPGKVSVTCYLPGFLFSAGLNFYIMGELAKIESYCELTKTSLIFKRDITKEEWMDGFNSLKKIEGCIQFWIGDFLAYRNQKWGMYDDIAEETGYEIKALQNIKSITDKVETSRRREELSFSHHSEVASLSPEKQTEFLNKAVEKKLSVRELREEIRKDNFNQLETPLLPKGKFSVIYADPAWPVGSIVMDKWESPIDDKYPVMTIEEIKNMLIQNISADDCSLFIWTTHSFLPDCLDIIKEWGFKYFCTITWNKGSGWTQNGFHKMTEFLLFGYKGKMNINQYGKAFPTLRNDKKSIHSKKPDKIRNLIKDKTPGGRLELFARQYEDDAKDRFEGWTLWGNEIKILDNED